MTVESVNLNGHLLDYFHPVRTGEAEVVETSVISEERTG